MYNTIEDENKSRQKEDIRNYLLANRVCPKSIRLREDIRFCDPELKIQFSVGTKVDAEFVADLLTEVLSQPMSLKTRIIRSGYQYLFFEPE